MGFEAQIFYIVEMLVEGFNFDPARIMARAEEIIYQYDPDTVERRYAWGIFLEAERLSMNYSDFHFPFLSLHIGLRNRFSSNRNSPLDDLRRVIHQAQQQAEVAEEVPPLIENNPDHGDAYSTDPVADFGVDVGVRNTEERNHQANAGSTLAQNQYVDQTSETKIS